MITLPDTDQLRAAQREAEAISVYPQSCVVAIDQLVDYETTPKLWAWLNEITHHLRTAHDLQYVDHPPERGPVFDPDDPGQQAAVFVHYVGEPNAVHVIRDGSGTRGWSPLHRYRKPEERCDIGDAPRCPGREGLWGMPLTVYMSVTRGSTIIVIEVCPHCVTLMTGVAEAGELQARIKGTITDASYKRRPDDAQDGPGRSPAGRHGDPAANRRASRPAGCADGRPREGAAGPHPHPRRTTADTRAGARRTDP